MQDFIVLGLIPGTQFQINFMLWLYISFSLFLSILILKERHQLHAAWLAWRVARLIKHGTAQPRLRF